MISNHIGSTDFILINELNIHNFTDSKYSFKRSLRFFPVFYQCCILMYFLILDRNFDQDRENIIKYLQGFKDMSLNAWIILFPEGHRFTERLSLESRKFCVNKGIKPYNNVLCPRLKGFNLIQTELVGSYINNILDVTFYCKNPPSIIDILFCRGNYIYECNYRIVDLNSITNSDDFLLEAFRRKDVLIENWKN